MIQTTDKHDVDETVGLYIEPDAIHIMKKSEYSGQFGDYSSYSEELDEMNEEAAEAAIEAVSGNARRFSYEAGDVIYHLLVLCEQMGVSLAQLEEELKRRHS
jgi:phosphoribosyl-ATP pyrophosphohydrolase